MATVATAETRRRIDAPLLNRRISLAPTAEALLALHDEHGWQMDALHHGNLWNKLGKSAREATSRGAVVDWVGASKEPLERLVRASATLLSSYHAQQLANVAHGAALAGISGPSREVLFAALSQRVLADGSPPLSGFEPRHIANLAWGFATAGYAPRALFRAIARAARPLLAQPAAPVGPSPSGAGRGKGGGRRGSETGGGGHEKGGGSTGGGFNEQELAMLVHAFSKSENGSLSIALARHVRSNAQSYGPSQLAALAPSLARLAADGVGTAKQRVALLRALKALARKARPLSVQMGPHDLEAFATAYTRLALRGWGAKLTRSIAAAAATAIRGRGDISTRAGAPALPPRHLCNLLWAVAKLASGCEIAMGRVATDSDVTALAEAAGREIASRLGASAGDLTAGSRSGPAHDPPFNSRDLSNAAWALLTLGLVDRRCLEAIGRASAAILETFNAQECSKLLGSLAKARVQLDELDAAASTLREVRFSFPSPVGDVALRHSIGGGRTLAGGPRRECTGATAATGFALWEDSYVLAEWLSRACSPAALAEIGVPPSVIPASLAGRKTWRGVAAVELGAGIGLCAVTAARLGMDVIATDGDARVVDLITSNIELNLHGSAGGGGARARGLRWGEPGALNALGLRARPDVVIATGCVYGASGAIWDALVATLDELAGLDTLVLLVHGNGTAPGTLEMQGHFYRAAAAIFEVARVPQQALHNEHDGCRLHCLMKKGQRASSSR